MNLNLTYKIILMLPVLKILHFYFIKNFKNDPSLPTDWINSKSISLFSPYGLSSFSYSTVGILMLIFYYNSSKNLLINFIIQGLLLITQSIITLLGDVIYVKKKNIFHDIDKYLASINTLIMFSNLFYITIYEKIIFFIGLINGLYIFKKSRKSRKNNDIMKYAYYHSIWHITFPLYIIIWLIYREIYVNN